MELIRKAEKMLEGEGVTCVILSGREERISRERGIRPLIDVLQKEPEILKNSVIADRVIGKSAAMLAVYSGVHEIYAGVISEYAKKVLEENHISFRYGKMVPYIINRNGDGMCPMEQLVLEETDPALAYQKLKTKINERRGVL